MKTALPATIKSPSTFCFFPFTASWQPYALLFLLGWVFYFNSLSNQYALDDSMIIQNNAYVLKGFGGLGGILSEDSYQSFYDQTKVKASLAGGRYRPLSVVSFALEQELIGTHPRGKYEANCWDCHHNGIKDPSEDANGDGVVDEKDCEVEGSALRHFDNVLLYVLSALMLFTLLKNYLFKKNSDVAFLAALLFLVHPIHTEVVANVKSRDEILSVLFFIATLVFAFRYNASRKALDLLLCAGAYALAFLSKEYAVTLAALVPLGLYVFTDGFDWKKRLPLWGVLLGGAAVYLIARLAILSARPTVAYTDILQNPYMFAAAGQALATKIFVLLKYLLLLVFPFPLSSDYSYNTIHYRSFLSPDVILSALVYAGTIAVMIVLARRRHPLSFALLFFLAPLAMVSNFVFNIGATMGERLVYHSSLGVVICLAWLAVEGAKRLPWTPGVKAWAVTGLSLALVAAAAAIVLPRNRQWKDDTTLFMADAHTVPNSVMVLSNAGLRCLDLGDLPKNSALKDQYYQTAMDYLHRVVSICPTYDAGLLDLGLAYFRQNDLVKAEKLWRKAQDINSGSPLLPKFMRMLSDNYMNQAIEAGKSGNVPQAVSLLDKASQVDPGNPEAWYNLGFAAYLSKDFAGARRYWTKCLQVKPDHGLARQGLAGLPPR